MFVELINRFSSWRWCVWQFSKTVCDSILPGPRPRIRQYGKIPVYN